MWEFFNSKDLHIKALDKNKQVECLEEGAQGLSLSSVQERGSPQERVDAALRPGGHHWVDQSACAYPFEHFRQGQLRLWATNALHELT